MKHIKVSVCGHDYLCIDVDGLMCPWLTQTKEVSTCRLALARGSVETLGLRDGVPEKSHWCWENAE